MSGLRLCRLLLTAALAAVPVGAARGADGDNPFADNPFASATIDTIVLQSVEGDTVREGLVNPDNHLDRPDAKAETALVAKGQIYDFRFRVRGQYNLTHRDDWYDKSDLILQELSREFQFSDDTTLLIGKTNLNWDVAYSSRPLGFFSKDVDLRDIEDRFDRTRGLPLIALTHIGDGWDVTGVISDDFGETRDGFNAGLRQWAIKAGTQFGATNANLIVQQPERQPVGYGFSATHAVGNSLAFHAEGFVRQGTRRPIHESVFTGQPRFYGADQNPYGEFRRNDNSWYPRWVVGGQWTSDELLNIIVEWVHDSRGLDDDQWRDFKNLARFHGSGRNFGLSDTAVNGNLARDALTYLTTGTRQDYLYLRFLQGGATWEPALSSFTSLEDGSTSFNFRLTYTGAHDWQFWIDARANVGLGGSEFGSVPEDGFVGAAFRYFF
jgi:hypothetical protein